jgi:hypothetical protein
VSTVISVGVKREPNMERLAEEINEARLEERWKTYMTYSPAEAFLRGEGDESPEKSTIVACQDVDCVWLWPYLSSGVKRLGW